MFDRAWLISRTCYGNWLPGDRRGFVGYHANDSGERVTRNEPGTDYADAIRRLNEYCRGIQKHSTMRLTTEHADALGEQFRETADHRKWHLPAAAVMANHLHLVVLVREDPEPETILHSFKSYGSRRLNRTFGKREWWTTSGSKVKLPDDEAIRAAVRYVRDQEFPLRVWVDESWLPDDRGEPSLSRSGEPVPS